MSDPQLENAAQAAAVTTETTLSLLDQVVGATKQTDRSVTEDLLKIFTREALKGTVRFDKNLLVTVNKAIEAIDAKISTQLNKVMHHPKFQKLEGSWRGLYFLVRNSQTGTNLKIKLLNLSKDALYQDLSRAVEFDQSQLFKKVYEGEFGTPGGTPFGALIGDYEFTNDAQDIETLSLVSHVAAAAFAPFISSASHKLMGMNSYTELSDPRDLASGFEGAEYASWRDFRDSDDSRFVSLVMPRVLSRLPYGVSGARVEEFNYEEAPLDKTGVARPMEHDDYAWMNAAYALGTRLTDAFEKYGWCTGIRGAEGGGKVEGLPSHRFMSDDGEIDQLCPTEIGITDRREKELSDLGFMALNHYRGTNYAVFFGAQTTQKPKKYDRPEATENAAISARLPYIMATSRIAHYLKVMARDRIGSFMEAADAERWLDRWIKNYVAADDGIGEQMKLLYPLRDARIEVKEVPGQPGVYNAVAYLRPWLQMEQLTTSLRLVARLPAPAK